MNVKELKKIIADLADDTEVFVEISYPRYDWKDTCTNIVDAEYDDISETLYINATIKN